MTTRVPPQAVEVERTVLGSILVDNSVADPAFGKLRVEHFYNGANRKIYQAMLDMSDRSTPIDVVTLSEALQSTNQLQEVGDCAYLAELSESVATAANIDEYVRILKRRSALRQIIRVAGEVSSQCFEPDADPDKIIGIFDRVAESIAQNTQVGQLVPIKDIIPDVFDRIQSYSKQEIIGVPTGLIDLDKQICGFEAGQFILIAGRPSTGKSTLAANIAVHVAVNKKMPVLIFSIEDSRELLTMRMLCSESGLSLHRIRQGVLPKREFPKLGAAAGPLAESPIWIDDSPDNTVRQIRVKSRMMSKKKRVGLIIVDYLQLMSSEEKRAGESRNNEVGAISRGLKKLTKEVGCPVVALSQLSRAVEQRKDPTPMLSDLRDSGAIEQDADVVLFTHRPCKYDSKADRTLAQIIVGKQKNGPVGVVNVNFDESTMTFRNRAKEAEYAEQQESHFAMEM